MPKEKFKINQHLFQETTHTPALIDLVGEKMLEQVIDFCFIENPYYPGENFFRELKSKLVLLLKSYPSSNPILAQKNLASVVGVNPEYLIIGNGATELITIIQNYLTGDMGIPVPTFSEYIDKIQDSEKVKLYQLPADEHYALNLNEYSQWLNQENLSAALVINPGNPTGQLLSVEEMTDFLEKMRHLDLVLLDESFIDFAGEKIPSLMPYVEEFSNLIIIRSMSKHCGVPGLRLGYCCTANEVFLKKIRFVLPVWNINTLAEYFLAQLKDTDKEYHIARKQVVNDVKELYQQLKTIEGLEVYRTGTNFILVKIQLNMTARDLQMKLLQEYGFYVRDCSNKVGLDKKHIRVASKGYEKDKLLVNALREIVSGFKTI